MSRYHSKLLHWSFVLSASLWDMSPKSIPWFCRDKKSTKRYTIYYYNTENVLTVYLHREVPCQIHIRFVLVHPDFRHSKSIASSVKGDVTVVGFFCSSNMCHSGTGQNFHAAPTQPNLGFENIHIPIKLQFWLNSKRKNTVQMWTERREAKL